MRITKPQMHAVCPRKLEARRRERFSGYLEAQSRGGELNFTGTAVQGSVLQPLNVFPAKKNQILDVSKRESESWSGLCSQRTGVANLPSTSVERLSSDSRPHVRNPGSHRSSSDRC